MIAGDSKKTTDAMVTALISNFIENSLVDVTHRGYTSEKEGIKVPIFQWVESSFTGVVQLGCMDTLFVINVADCCLNQIVFLMTFHSRW